MTESWQMTERNYKVDEAIECLKRDERCKGSAMGKLVDLVDKNLLQLDPEARFHRGKLYHKIHEILDECESNKTHLGNHGTRSDLPEVFTEPPGGVPVRQQLLRAECRPLRLNSNKSWCGASTSCEEPESAVVITLIRHQEQPPKG